MLGVAVLVARLDLAANSQTCWVSGLRFGRMPLKRTLPTICKDIFLSQEHQVWSWEHLVCGPVAKGETVLCARLKIGLFWKMEGEGSETAQLTIPDAPEASVCAVLLQNGNGG